MLRTNESSEAMGTGNPPFRAETQKGLLASEAAESLPAIPESVGTGNSAAGDMSQLAIGRRSLRGTIWTVLGNGVSQAVLLLGHILCARIIGRENYGKLGAVLSTTATFGLLAGLGLSLTATKYVAEFRKSDPIRARRILALSERLTAGSGIAIALILIALSKYLAVIAFSSISLKVPLEIASVTILFTCVNTLQTASLAALERFRQSSKLAALRALISLPLMVAGAYIGGVTGSVTGLLAGNVMACTIGHVMVRNCLREERLAFPVSDIWQEKAIFWSFSLPALLGGILASGANWALNVILVHESATFRGIAVLNASRQWLSALTFLPVAIGAGAMPVLSSVSQALHNREALKEALRVPSVLVRVCIWPVTLTLLLLSPEILKAYGASYIDGIWTFLWMIGGVAVGYTGYVGSLLVQSRGMMWFGFTHQVVYTVVSLTVGYLLCRTSGELGIAQGVAAGYVALLLWMLGVLVIKYDFPFELARDMLRDGFLMIGLVVLLSRYIVHLPMAARLAVTIISVTVTVWHMVQLREFREAFFARLSVFRRAA